jgi:arylsulfatase A-like enzyme
VSSRLASALLAFGLSVLSSATRSTAVERTDVILVTLDTVRADVVGVYGGQARTPTLDRLAGSGVRFAHALAPAPITLPTHASLLTGLDPIQHGLRVNGQGVLPTAAATLPERLRAAGYVTIAAVGSRVLDRRFGLDRGFDLYDDRMAAERLGEFGYAERPAGEVVDALLAAADRVPISKPLFAWAHFYDAHAPYEGAGGDEAARYRAEIENVDRELGRLLTALERGRPRWVVVVGDHGESFGEHGEDEHGYLLHEPTLAVPLVVVGPTAPAGAVRTSPVGTVRIASTLAVLAGLGRSAIPGPPLDLDRENAEAAIYHEAEMPAATFGWSPLSALTRGRFRLVEGAQLALHDLAADPGELVDRARESAERTRAMRAELGRLRGRKALNPEPAARDEELAKALASLGYLSAAGAGERGGTIDPREGVKLLAQFEAAKARVAAGDLRGGIAALRELVKASPRSVPFLARLADAEQSARDFVAARRTLDAALLLAPESEFLHLASGNLERDAGRPESAEREYRQALVLNPRMASATLALGELLARSGRAEEELAVLRAAVAAETESGVLLTRLAEVELVRGDLGAADEHARRATELLPQWPPAWRLWARVAAKQGRADLAAQREARASRQ